VINELGRLKILVESLKADITDLLGLQLLQQQQSLLNRTAATTSSTTTSMGSPSFSAGGGGSSEQVTRVYQFNPELPRLPQIQDKMIFYNLFFQSQQGSVSSSSSSSASFADAGSHTRKKNETWKFLGRALFELHISKAICDMFQDSAESERLILKSVMISDENLTRWAKLYLFDGYLNYKDAVVVADKEKILADVFLAYVAAVYEDDAESTDRIKSWLKEILQYDLRTGSIRSYIEAHERKEQEKETQNNNTTTTTTTSQGTAPSASGASSSSTALDQDLAPWSKPFSEMTPEDQIKYAKDHLYSRLSPTFTPTYQILSQTKPPAQPSFETVCVVNGEVVGYGKSSNIKTAKAKAAFDAMLSNKAVIEKYELIRQNVVKNKKMGKPEMFPVSFEKQVAHLLGKRQLDRVTNGTHEEIDY
jgi:dsRNA-specific ribonuclease